MRTSFTLEDDLAPLVKRLVKRKQKSLNRVLNDLIRAAINSISAGEAVPRKKIALMPARNIGLKKGIDPTKLNQIAFSSDE